MKPPIAFLVANAGLLTLLPGQQHQVVPAAYTTNDAISYNWFAGASREVRQQTLVGASHLGNLAGRVLTGISLRRTAVDEIYQGGQTDLTVSLSITPVTPLACSTRFDTNVGPTPQVVFQGTVTIPTSPADVGPSVAWTPQNIIDIPFQTPFAYAGGTLCIDIVGTPIAGQNANWWMADAEFEDIEGTTTDLGGGCGAYGGPDGEWSFISTRTLLAGGHALMSAYGTPHGLALAAVGPRAVAGLPLAMLGLPAATECELHLAAFDFVEAKVFVPDPHPMLVSRGGYADVELKIPPIPQALGVTMTTQWFDLSQVASSNAIEWTICPATPSLDMALIEGHPEEATGTATVHLAHVWRFEYQ